MKFTRTLSAIITIILTYLSCASCAVAQPIDIQSVDDSVLTQTITHANPKTTLIILDIDNTLLTERRRDNLIGGPAWFQWQQTAIQNHSSDALADNMADFFPFNSYVLRHMHTVQCEPDQTAAFVDSLETKGFTVIAATARDANVNFATRHELNKQNIVMSPQSIKLPAGEERSLGNNTLYSHGILYLQGQDKATFVKKLLIASHQLSKYKQFIYLDDTLKNLTSFEQSYNSESPQTTTDIHTFHYNQDQWQQRYFQTTALDSKQLLTQDQQYLKDYCQYSQNKPTICANMKS